LKFENAIISGVLTPVSMACIFTGKYCERVKSKSLAEVLSKNGFITLAFHFLIHMLLDTLDLIGDLVTSMITFGHYGWMKKVITPEIRDGENL